MVVGASGSSLLISSNYSVNKELTDIENKGGGVRDMTPAKWENNGNKIYSIESRLP